MSDVRMVMLAGYIIATCANDYMHRGIGYVMVIVSAVILITTSIAGAALGVDV